MELNGLGFVIKTQEGEISSYHLDLDNEDSALLDFSSLKKISSNASFFEEIERHFHSIWEDEFDDEEENNLLFFVDAYDYENSYRKYKKAFNIKIPAIETVILYVIHNQEKVQIIKYNLSVGTFEVNDFSISRSDNLVEVLLR